MIGKGTHFQESDDLLAVLELMFSSIEPFDPCRHIFPATSFPLFVLQSHTRQPMKRWPARVLRLPANQLRAVFPCLRSTSQSIFTRNSVKLLDSSVYFPHTSISRIYRNLL